MEMSDENSACRRSSAVIALWRARAGADLPGQAGPDHHRLRAGQRHRRRRAADGRPSGNGLGPAGRHHEPAGRRRVDRGAGRIAGHARRLHALRRRRLDLHRAQGRARRRAEPADRVAARLHAHRLHHPAADVHRRGPAGRRQLPERADRACEAETGRTVLRHHRPRPDHTPDDGVAADPRRHQAADDPLHRRSDRGDGRSRDRPRCRRARRLFRSGAGPDRRPDQGPRGRFAGAARRLQGPADRGGDAAGIPRRRLERPARAGRHAGRHRAEGERRSAQGDGRRRAQEEARGARRLCASDDAATGHRLRSRSSSGRGGRSPRRSPPKCSRRNRRW